MTAPISSAAQRSAQSALEQARPVIARLDASRHPEELAADLIDAWAAVETSLRALIGGSSLTGQALIRDLRSRQVITFDQANGLAQFHAARERADRTDYQPTAGDVDAARDGFFKLHTALQQHAASLEMIPPGMATPLYTEAMREQGMPLPGSPAAKASSTVAPPPGSPRKVRSDGRPPWLLLLLGVLVLIGIGGGAWALMRGRDSGSTLQSAIAFYNQGQRERANAEFAKAARENPRDATPHIYLSRMAREVGNLPLARDEAVAAVEADKTNGAASRELGSVMFTMGNYEAARKFYVRAIDLDGSDRTSMGFLGCSLARLGRFDAARRFLERAGPGDWSACLRALPPPGTPDAAPGMMPPGQQMPAQMPGQMPGQMPMQQMPPQGPAGQPAQGQYIPRPN